MKPGRLSFLGLLSFFAFNYVAAADFSLGLDDNLPAYCSELLRTQDFAAFAKQVCPSIQDYEAEARRFGRNLTPDERAAIEQSLPNHIRNLTRSGEEFVKLGKRFGFFAPGAHWQFKGAKAGELKMTSHNAHEEETIPFLPVIRLMFRREASAENAAPVAGDYSIDLIYAMHFPEGWRTFNGMRWSGCPKGAVPDDLLDDIQIAALFLAPRQTFTDVNDRALNAVAENLKALFTAPNTAAAAEKLMYTSERFVRVAQDRSTGRPVPSKEEIDGFLADRKGELLASAESLISDTRKSGLDFSAAEIVQAVAENVRIHAYPGGLPERFFADDLRITLRLPTSIKEGGGNFAGGDYVIGCASAERLGGTWYMPKLRWAGTPNARDEEARKIALENYVAEFRKLPHGTVAPDVELLSLTPEIKHASRLSDYRGKFVILEWWATWCAPCQEPMARLQKIREAHPSWGEQVKIITLSLDKDTAAAANHLRERGWTNTLNFGAGGRFDSPAAKAFRISGIPEVYLVSTNGTIIDSDPRVPVFTQLDGILKSQ
jgi:thiol-disulfide isomerase/thioredoxin